MIKSQLVGEGKQPGFTIGLAVEIHFFSSFDIWVVAFAVAPKGFLAINHRPAQSPGLVIQVEWCQVMGLTTAKDGVLFK
ncbi:hypothetical protein [Endozoicomonas sp. SCSIO W0465]|uniref:hypothetical protein n=1 Tax=Endozoicomonas sp. SCSIO W0465 TaxID=2918516 RepID=UPI002075F627|nr:hypothetical protein [Endozoicomonas sp. SCSIO W0465]USE34318.1 hypothetical protein MJO57_19430 [Endozoicomonas sp. SCSIO W0465]